MSRNILRRVKHGVVTIVVGLTAALIVTNGQAQDRGFQFGVFGDTPYPDRKLKEAVRAIKAMNREDLAFVVHVGDYQGASRRSSPSSYKFMPCSDRHMAGTLDLFRLSAHPFILTPGDNDWTDCPKIKGENFDPLERLAKVRSMFFPKGKSLGRRTIAVKSQSLEPTHAKFVENLTWNIGGIQFVTLHIVGSNDNFTSGEQPKLDAEHKERMAANLAWMKQAFATARSDTVRGLVLIAHANPRFENHWRRRTKSRYLRGIVGAKAPKKSKPIVYDKYSKALRKEMETFAKPTLYIHGSTHTFRVNKPLYGKKGRRVFQNFTRLETFGNPDTHWVRVTVDPSYSGLFSIRPEIVQKNRAHHRN